MPGTLPDIWKKEPTNMVYGFNEWYPPVGHTYSNEPLFKYV